MYFTFIITFNYEFKHSKVIWNETSKFLSTKSPRPLQRILSGNPPKMQPVLNTPQNDSSETTLRICTGSFPPFINKSHPLKFYSVNGFVNGLSPNTEGLRLTPNCPNWLSLQMYVIDRSCFPEEITSWRQKGTFHFTPLILKRLQWVVIESHQAIEFRLDLWLTTIQSVEKDRKILKMFRYW